MRRNGGLSLCCKVNDFYYRRMVVPGVVAHDYCRSVSALLAACRLCSSDVVNISSLGRFLRLLSVWGDYRRPCQLLSKQLSVFLEISGAEADVPAGTGARAAQARAEQTRIRTVAPAATTNREVFSAGAVDIEVCFWLPCEQCKFFELFALAFNLYIFPTIPGVILFNVRVCGDLDTGLHRGLLGRCRG